MEKREVVDFLLAQAHELELAADELKGAAAVLREPDKE